MSLLKHTTEFCASYGLDVPIIMAPMAGACPVGLASAVSNAGGMGACGALLMDDGQIHDWVSQFRDMSNGAFMLNNWIEEPAPARNKRQEEQMRAFYLALGLMLQAMPVMRPYYHLMPNAKPCDSGKANSDILDYGAV